MGLGRDANQFERELWQCMGIDGNGKQALFFNVLTNVFF
jgi:hypothetical protein